MVRVWWFKHQTNENTEKWSDDLLAFMVIKTGSDNSDWNRSIDDLLVCGSLWLSTKPRYHIKDLQLTNFEILIFCNFTLAICSSSTSISSPPWSSFTKQVGSSRLLSWFFFVSNLPAENPSEWLSQIFSASSHAFSDAISDSDLAWKHLQINLKQNYSRTTTKYWSTERHWWTIPWSYKTLPNILES